MSFLQKNVSDKSKIKYRLHCKNQKDMPIFSQAWWLDAVAGNDFWDVVLVENDGQIVASMPFAIRKRFGRTILSLPPLTQNLGPWVSEIPGKQSTRMSVQKKLLQKLIDELPNYDHFSANWHFSQTNWLPFYWAGFSQTTAYTYRLPILSDHEKIWNGLRENIRTDIRKAKSRFGLKIKTDTSLDAFLKLNKKSFLRQKKDFPYQDDLISCLDNACIKNNARRIFIAEDEQGRAHAGVYLVWDAKSAYYLMGGSDPNLRKSGAASYCLWEAIKFSSTVTESFDFEGSMIEPIERFFRAFGAIQTPYFGVTHTPSKLIKIAHFTRDLLN